MIRYDLICDQGHAFDGWFRDSAAYDAQPGAGWWLAPIAVRRRSRSS